jgi:large conductance mechanosensitive channel
MKRLSETFKEFRTFALHGNAIDLAIGVAVGAAFTAVVQAIIAGIITPLIAAIFGEANFSALTFTIHGSHFTYGLVINAIFTLFAVAATLFFLVVKPIAAIKHRLGRDPQVEAISPCPSCFSPINPEAKRCPFCTESLEPGWSAS